MGKILLIIGLILFAPIILRLIPALLVSVLKVIPLLLGAVLKIHKEQNDHFNSNK